MSSKSEITYMLIFKYLKKHVFSLECHSFTVDYETALQNALRKVFPGCDIVSCWFHFAQAVKKNISMMPHLYELIRTKKEARLL